jgi:hypothetical protein
MFNKIDPNDLIFPGSPAEAALHQNVELLGLIIIAFSIAIGYWLGSNGPNSNKIARSWLIFAVILSGVFAGTLLGIEGGLLIVFWAGIGLGAGLFVGIRNYKRSRPDR